MMFARSDHEHAWRLDGRCQYAGCNVRNTVAVVHNTVVNPPTIDPADVKVGDVVEVEANDGSWLARGEVTGIYPQHDDEYRIFLLDLDGHQAPVAAKHATVRLVRRAEPEPDPEQVKALAKVMRSLPPIAWDSSEEYARELVRHGVTVREQP